MANTRKLQNRNFRAIIIGGGPVGLTVANSLDRAGLDYLVVERYPTITSESGAGILLWPHSLRVFHQLGLLESCQGRYVPLKYKTNMNLHGKEMQTMPVFSSMGENHGYEGKNLPRPQLLRTLYEGLGGKTEKIRTGVSVEDIEMGNHGVRVRLSDGSVEKGSIVVGADGVHSMTRTIMQRLAKEAGRDFASEEDPMVATYQIMYGRAKTTANSDFNTFFETHGTYRSTQVSADKDRGYFAIYRKLPKPTTDLKYEYTSSEIAEFVNAFSDVMVMPRLSFQELYANREWTRLVNQHEGRAKHWYFGRVVLVGDASVQMTAAAGMGVNTGIQSAVALVNKIYEVLSAETEPDTETFARAFAAYQEIRRTESRLVCEMAAQVMRVNTWDSYLSWFLGDVVIPWTMSNEKMAMQVGNEFIRNAHKLDFIDIEFRSGKIPWGSS